MLCRSCEAGSLKLLSEHHSSADIGAEEKAVAGPSRCFTAICLLGKMMTEMLAWRLHFKRGCAV